MRQLISSLFKKHPAFSLIGISGLFLLIEGLYSFCSPKPAPLDAQCPAFADANFETWFPYQPAQMVLFTSSLANKDTITIENVTRSVSYPTTSAMLNTCNSNVQISSVQNYLSTSSKKFNIWCYKTPEATQLQLTLLNFNTIGSFSDSSFTPLASDPYTSQTLSSVIINGRSFNTIIEVTRDTLRLNWQGVYKVWLSKQHGLVGYETTATHERWVLQ